MFFLRLDRYLYPNQPIRISTSLASNHTFSIGLLLDDWLDGTTPSDYERLAVTDGIAERGSPLERGKEEDPEAITRDKQNGWKGLKNPENRRNKRKRNWTVRVSWPATVSQLVSFNIESFFPFRFSVHPSPTLFLEHLVFVRSRFNPVLPILSTAIPVSFLLLNPIHGVLLAFSSHASTSLQLSLTSDSSPGHPPPSNRLLQLTHVSSSSPPLRNTSKPLSVLPCDGIRTKSTFIARIHVWI